MRGVPGLAICLSQPFQRLLKYPLLFQSLLYQYVAAFPVSTGCSRCPLLTTDRSQHRPLYTGLRCDTSCE